MSQNDKRLIKDLSVWGAVFAVVVGTLLHFCYEWSGNNFIVGLFAPVNESPWEHMKLTFTPILLFGIIDYYYLRGKVSNLCLALFKEIGVAIVFILAVFYIYTSIVGHSILFIDITSFILGIVLAKWIGYLFLSGKFKRFEFNGSNIIGAVLLTLLTAFFVYATINPPRIDPFHDSVTNSYGIYEKGK